MRKLQVAVIGTGFWGRNHARVFKELEETELLAVCDTNRERVESIAKQFQVKGYTNSAILLEKEEVEAVSICTWSISLAEEAERALRAGKHVLVEKPMASNVKQAKKLQKMVLKQELLLSVGFLMRFIPAIQQIKRAIEKKTIGNLVCATAKRVSKWPERIGDIGVIKDTAIHDIDIIRYFFEEEPTAVYAKSGSMKHKKFEDYAQIMLSFKDSKSAFIESNWLTPYKTRTLTITGSKAIIKLDYITQEISIEHEKETMQPRNPWQEPLKLELQHFANTILKRERPLITGMDGLKALQIAEAALKSSSMGKVVHLQ
jgi:UDP-N-acetylglucosamine 3-dehydrogenase